jgi:hypothetical protein
VVTYFYPDVSKSPSPGNPYAGYTLAKTSLPLIDKSIPRHVAIAVDMVTPSGTAVARCGGRETSTVPSSGLTIPRGIVAPATVTLGYQFVTSGVSAPPWSLSYDNMLFRVAP